MDEIPTLDPVAAYALWAESYPPQAHNPLMQAEERAMLALLPADLRGRRILDAGCGSGRYLSHALGRGARAALGVDLSGEMLARAARALVPPGRSNVRVLPPRPQVSKSWGLGDLVVNRSAELRRRVLVDEKTCVWLARGSLDALPVRDRWADLAICGLTIGHLADLDPPLAELRRATRPGGLLLCSDFHPVGSALGWRREFSAGGRRFAVRHTTHLYSHWQRACARLGLRIVRVLEPYLDPADIPPGAQFDRRALDVPVALVFELRRES